jgi:biopolymer transport protein ExbB
MRKLSNALLLIAFMFFLAPMSYGQDESASSDTTEQVGEADTAEVEEVVEPEVVEEQPTALDESETEETQEEPSFHQRVKEKFIEGGWEFMGIVLLCLILGLAISIERIITLNIASSNTNKLLDDVETALTSGGVDEAKKVCAATRGPIASIFSQGLTRISEGIEMVEKSIISYGSVEMGRLEKGLVWISLFISLAPMLGFMGTVIGMIAAFDAIQAAGDISPQIVAGGIKVALLTTVAGLIVAVILQVFYNYLVSKIDGLVNQMEDASISFVDLLVRNNLGK